MKPHPSATGLPMLPANRLVKNFGATNQGAAATRAKSTLPMMMATIVAASTPHRMQA